MADVGNNLHRLCASSELLEGNNGLRFFVKIERDVRPAFVLRSSSQVRAYLNECAHQAVELDLQKGKFLDRSGKFIICAAHGATYDPTTGECAGGRCDGRSLKSLSVVEIDKIVSFEAGDGIEFVSLDDETE